MALLAVKKVEGGKELKATASRGVFDCQTMPWWDDRPKGPVPYLGPVLSFVGGLLKISAGFSIVLMVISMAIPFTGGSLIEAQRTKAKQDLDVVRNAISLYVAQNKPLTGTSLEPLLGRYLQELPCDPWGNPYVFDGNVGFCASYGPDGLAGGQNGDEDYFVYCKPALTILAALTERDGNEFGLIVTFNKGLIVVNEQELLSSLCLISAKGVKVPLSNEGIWTVNHSKSRPRDGVIVFQQKNIIISPVGKLTWVIPPGNSSIGGGVQEQSLEGGALDAKLFGEETKRYLQRPRSPELPLDIEITADKD